MADYDYEVAVVGGGSAGYAAARTAANADLRTVVIEGGSEVGGLCILRGCMPTKALLYAAEVKHLAQHPETWGIKSRGVTFDLANVMARKDAMIRDFAGHRVTQLTEATFDFVRANARFIDPHTVVLDDGKKISSRHFIIATGSSVAPPPAEAAFLSGIHYLTSDEALNLERLPKSMIVLGGGAVAVEFAQFFARFDVQTTVVQRGTRLLKEFDMDAAGVLEKVFQRERITLFTNSTLTGASSEGGSKRVSILHQGRDVSIVAEQVLFALGRVPNTASLDLARAGVATDGLRIVTNEGMQTSVPHIYAAGDCASPYEIVHLAVLQGEIAARNIATPSRPRRMNYRLLTEIVFTEPQMAKVGLTEKEALSRKIPYMAASYSFADHGKSMIMGTLEGFVKLLADPVSGEMLGGACVGPVGGELIHVLMVAMDKRMNVREFASLPFYHPTLTEIWSYPAEELADRIGLPHA